MHTLYFHVLTKEAVVNVLARLSGSTEFREPVFGNTCLSALVLNHLGEPVARTYSPAAFIYGIKILREKHDPEKMEEFLRKAHEDYSDRFRIEKEQADQKDEQPEINSVNWMVLRKESAHLQALARNELKADISILCVSETVAPTTNPEAPFLNSYYLNDLNELAGHPEDMGEPMEIFLSEQVDMNARHDLLSQQSLLDHLHPQDQSPGRWPSNPAFGLYSAQQVALNLALTALRPRPGLLGINGPPGTGKTTLLREIVADVVVARARRLLDIRVPDLFAGKRNKIIEMMGYYNINSSVFGNDGIVVSSNNNAAVENISKELPVLKSIDLQTFTEATYFSSMATNIHEEPCWGMLSAVLGKSKNRNAFVSRFWFSKIHGFGKYLKSQYEDPAQREQHAKRYEEKAGELKALLEEYDVFHMLAGEYHDLLCKTLAHSKDGGQQEPRLEELATRLKDDYGILPANIPGLRFLDQPVAEIHKLTPYSSEKINILRSRIFLRSLELHEYAILVNGLQFQCNLNAFVNMVSNKHKDFISEEIAATLWNSFFFCIPVVSVTLASFQRQFPKMGKGSIGWLLLDEAGQATPSSVCGAIWRSKRCIIIGDTLQIPPVVTIPKGLGKLLQDSYGLIDGCWSPIHYSAQFLADRVTASGTEIKPDNGASTWTGIPLRAHRRCSEPMFSISNAIAYDGQMVKVTQGNVIDIPTGKSGWIDVKGITQLKDHVIGEELDVVEDLLIQLAYFTGKIYVISPFRSIAEECRTKFNVKDRVECGTIHTFQGKEAEIVFLVLGTQEWNTGARAWVSGSPNMLNVAVTRAKERLYVIGNRKAWMALPYFSELAERLPVKEHFSGRLF